MRKQRGMTLQDLADEVDASRDQIHRLEKGRRGLTDIWMRRLAKALECKASDLLPDADFSPRLKSDEAHLLHMFRQLSEDNRSRYLTVSESIRFALSDAEKSAQERLRIVK